MSLDAIQVDAVHSSRFVYPPLDIPLESVFEFHLKENPDHVVFTYPVDDGSSFKSYTYAEFVPGVHRTGQMITEALRPVKETRPQVVVILLQADPVTYLTTLSGLMRAGITAFPVSYRFSATVIAYLLKKSQTTAIIVNSATEGLATQALELMECAERPVVLHLPHFASLYPGHNEYTPLPEHDREQGEIAILTHSSSSTSLFPKIISWSSYTISHHGEIKDMPAHSLPGQILSTPELEFFHSLGMCVFFTVVRRGLILGLTDPSTPSYAQGVSLFKSLVRIQPNFIMTNPRAIETWAEDPNKVDSLQKMGVNIVFGGRFLRQSVGDMLARSGVRISSAYGSTETGPLVLFPHFQGEDWDYFTINPRPDVSFVPRSDGLLEVIVSPMRDQTNYLGATNMTLDGMPAYNPGDLFIAHPTKPHTYKMFGRLNDQILLASGETVNPIDFETELLKHSMIASVVMFGHSRPTVGIVIEPTNKVQLREKEFVESIWTTIADMNSKFPPYSRISQKMIIVASTTKPISISPKGLPRRPLVWQQYQDEMDACYRLK